MLFFIQIILFKEKSIASDRKRLGQVLGEKGLELWKENFFLFEHNISWT